MGLGGGGGWPRVPHERGDKSRGLGGLRQGRSLAGEGLPFPQGKPGWAGSRCRLGRERKMSPVKKIQLMCGPDLIAAGGEDFKE